MSIINIAVEGVDGAGKGLVLSHLNSYIEKFSNIEVSNLKFPGGDPNHIDYDYIRKICKSEKYYFDEISSHINLMNMITNVSNEYLKYPNNQHKIILNDRYFASCLAYDNLRPKGMGEQFIVDYMNQYEHTYPDLTILCLPDEKLCVENNIGKSDCETEKRVSTDAETLNILNSHYKSYMGKYFKNYRTINTFSNDFKLNMNEICEEVVSLLVYR